MKTFLATWLLLLLVSVAHAQQQQIYCQNSGLQNAIPCNTNGPPAQGGTGDPGWLVGGKVNANFGLLFQNNSQLQLAILGVDAYSPHADGVLDDSTAFNSALAACTAAGGGTVVVGPHRYYLNSTIVIPNNCRLQGTADTLPYQAFTANYFQTQPFTLLLGSGVTIQVGSSSTPDHTAAIAGLNIVRSGLPVATSIPTGLATVAAFSGTGITVPHASGDAILENLVIAGFNLCIDVESFRPHLRNILGDCTNGSLYNTVTDYSQISNVVWQSLLTPNLDAQYNVTAVANSGGLAQITVTGTSTGLANGNTVLLSQLGGRTDLNGKWTIGNVATGGGNTTFTLTGSSFAGPAITGNTTNGSPYVSTLSATSQLGYFGGQTITDGSGCIPGGTTILWVNPDTSTLQLSANATCTQATDALTVTAASYTSGGVVDFNAMYRSGYGFKVTNSQGMFFTNVFDWGHQTAYDISTGATWQQFTNFGCDGLSVGFDPTRVCVLIEDTASMAQFVNGVILDAGVAIKQNTTGAQSGASFRSIVDDITVYANVYLGAELLSGGMLLGSGANFRSTQPHLIGNSATVQMTGTNSQTASPPIIFQSTAAISNLKAALVAAPGQSVTLAYDPVGSYNNICVVPANTGSTPVLKTCGVDANRALSLQANGTSAVNIGNSTNGVSVQVGNCPSGVCANQVSLAGNAAGSRPGVAAIGSDTNVDLGLTPKGTGVIVVGNAGSIAANGAVATALTSVGPTGSHTTVQEWLIIKNSSGTVRYIPLF